MPSNASGDDDSYRACFETASATPGGQPTGRDRAPARPQLRQSLRLPSAPAPQLLLFLFAGLRPRIGVPADAYTGMTFAEDVLASRGWTWRRCGQRVRSNRGTRVRANGVQEHVALLVTTSDLGSGAREWRWGHVCVRLGFERKGQAGQGAATRFLPVSIF